MRGLAKGSKAKNAKVKGAKAKGSKAIKPKVKDTKAKNGKPKTRRQNKAKTKDTKRMGTFKWIGGILGWVSGGPIGALIGVLLGSIAESGIMAVKQLSGAQDTNPNGWSGTSQGNGQSGTGQGNGQRGASYQEQQRSSFMVSLLVLSSAVIRADGKFLQSEFDYVKQFIRNNFGPMAEYDAMRILDELNKKEINVYSVGAQIAQNMNYSQRLQLFHYLVELANADGELCQAEKSVLESIAAAIGINSNDASSCIAMYYKDADSAYAVLEISPNATNDEVKAAYRKMAMKNHPDKVASLGPDVQKSAEQKFRKIQEAYETIKKQRGIQ